MDPLSLSQLAKYSGAAIEQGKSDAIISRVGTDSRTIKAGELFVALRGDKFDAHQFLGQVADAGAAGAVVDRAWTGKISGENFALLRAEDTLVAYQTLAANYRKSLPLKVLGITGSNGKTSTKDFAASILGRGHRVTKTEGNFNNHVGLPRTMLEATRSDEFGVWELGMNHPGEIEALATMAAPDAAIITNIGIAHIEFLGSREAIAFEKGMLAETITSDGFVVLNGDDAFSEAIGRRAKARVILAGIERGEVRAEDVRQTARGCEFTIVEEGHRARAALPVPGLHMVENAMLAVAAGRAFGLSLEDCAAALATTPLTRARLQIREVRGVQFIDDSYNANPDSMKAALRTLMELESEGQRVAVLGNMFELGEESERGHREVAEAAASLGVDRLIVLGNEMMARVAQEAGLVHSAVAPDASVAAEMLQESVHPGDLVLIKGSRSARTELVLEEFARLAAAGEAAR